MSFSDKWKTLWRRSTPASSPIPCGDETLILVLCGILLHLVLCTAKRTPFFSSSSISSLCCSMTSWKKKRVSTTAAPLACFCAPPPLWWIGTGAFWYMESAQNVYIQGFAAQTCMKVQPAVAENMLQSFIFCLIKIWFGTRFLNSAYLFIIYKSLYICGTKNVKSLKTQGRK